MTPRALLGLGVTTALVTLAWLTWPSAPPPPSPGELLLPELSARIPTLSRVRVRSAGETVVATLELTDGQWQLAQRQHWPANAAIVAGLIDDLAKTRQLEAKTRDPQRHARLGVEAISAADATGLEVCLEGGGEPVCVLLGDAHPATGRSYARRSGQNPVWLTDHALELPRKTPDWLDRRLMDRALARIERVEVAPARGKAYRLTRVQDRFSLDGLPPVAMADPERGNGTAAVADALTFEEVAPDPGTVATQHARFIGVDGLDVTLAAWTADDGTWLRCTPVLDDTRATAWLKQSKQTDLSALRGQFEQIQQRCAGHAFRLPAFKADNLMRSREHFLAD